MILNGRKVINNQPIPGCTNGALHSDETLPGPLYLQGDHTSVSYRNIVLTPVLTSIPSVGEWPQAAGPTGNFITQGNAPKQFSGATGDNVSGVCPCLTLVRVPPSYQADASLLPLTSQSPRTLRLAQPFLDSALMLRLVRNYGVEPFRAPGKLISPACSMTTLRTRQ